MHRVETLNKDTCESVVLSKHKKDMELLEQVQTRAMRMIRGLDHDSVIHHFCVCVFLRCKSSRVSCSSVWMHTGVWAISARQGTKSCLEYGKDGGVGQGTGCSRRLTELDLI